jgi:hypothetical protein
MPLEDYIRIDGPKFIKEKERETTDILLYIHNELTGSNKNAITVTGACVVVAFFSFVVGAVGFLASAFFIFAAGAMAFYASARVLSINCGKRAVIQAILRGRECVFSVPGDTQDLVLTSRPSEVRLSVIKRHHSLIDFRSQVLRLLPAPSTSWHFWHFWIRVELNIW